MSAHPDDLFAETEARRPHRWLSVDWIAVLVAGLLVVAVATGLLPVIPW